MNVIFTCSRDGNVEEQPDGEFGVKVSQIYSVNCDPGGIMNLPPLNSNDSSKENRPRGASQELWASSVSAKVRASVRQKLSK